jgi:hypothetical protein
MYLRKLLEEFPTTRRDRFWRRDFLFPRFLPHLVAELVNAVQRHDRDLMRTSLENLRLVSCYHNRQDPCNPQTAAAAASVPRSGKGSFRGTAGFAAIIAAHSWLIGDCRSRWQLVPSPSSK